LSCLEDSLEYNSKVQNS